MIMMVMMGMRTNNCYSIIRMVINLFFWAALLTQLEKYTKLVCTLEPLWKLMRSREYSKEKCEITMAANCVYLGKRVPSQKKNLGAKKNMKWRERGEREGKRREEEKMGLKWGSGKFVGSSIHSFLGYQRAFFFIQSFCRPKHVNWEAERERQFFLAPKIHSFTVTKKNELFT